MQRVRWTRDNPDISQNELSGAKRTLHYQSISALIVLLKKIVSGTSFSLSTTSELWANFAVFSQYIGIPSFTGPPPEVSFAHYSTTTSIKKLPAQRSHDSWSKTSLTAKVKKRYTTNNMKWTIVMIYKCIATASLLLSYMKLIWIPKQATFQQTLMGPRSDQRTLPQQAMTSSLAQRNVHSPIKQLQFSHCVASHCAQTVNPVCSHTDASRTDGLPLSSTLTKPVMTFCSQKQKFPVP